MSEVGETAGVKLFFSIGVIISLLLSGCLSSQESPAPASAVAAESVKPWEDGAKQAVAALIRGDGEELLQIAHFDLIQNMRKRIIETIKANPTAALSADTMRAFQVSSADEIQALGDAEFLNRAMKTVFFNNTDSPRVKLTGNGLKAIRSYYLDGVYQVIMEGESKPAGIMGKGTVTVYMRRLNVHWRYYGDPSLFVITSMPKEFQARDMAIDAAEKGNYTVVDAGNPQRQKDGWRVLVFRRRGSSPEADAVSVFVSEDFKTVKVRPMMRVGDPDLSRIPRRPFR
jgi:hypothetical protein